MLSLSLSLSLFYIFFLKQILLFPLIIGCYYMFIFLQVAYGLASGGAGDHWSRGIAFVGFRWSMMWVYNGLG